MKKKLLFIPVFVVLSLCLMGFTYQRFAPNAVLKSEIFELDVGLKSYKEVTKIIFSTLDNFEYTLKTDDNREYILKLLDICKPLSESDIFDFLVKFGNSPFFNGDLEVSLNNLVVFNSSKISDLITTINKDTERIGIKTPENSQIVFNNGTYSITSSKKGNLLNQAALGVITEELKKFNSLITLNELNCYTTAEIVESNLILKTNLETYLNYSLLKLNYIVETDTVSIDINTYNSWLNPNYINTFELDKINPFTVDIEKVKEFVKTLSDKYDTMWNKRSFTTSTNEVVALQSGNYGWVINNNAIVEDIVAHILNQFSEDKEIIYKQKAEKFGSTDIGNSYIEISIANQRLWMYKDGVLLVDTPIVTGSVSAGHSTPRGVYKLTYKTRNTVLRGPGYASPVSYWMPFNGGIGLHDATWRSNFGGTIYKTNGSHGCVNIPKKNAKIIYENITNTMPIILW